MHPEHYLRHPRCYCKGERKAIKRAKDDGASQPITYRVDKYRSTGRENPPSKTCWCLGYHHPHHIGRGWCFENTRLTESDLQNRLTY